MGSHTCGNCGVTYRSEAKHDCERLLAFFMKEEEAWDTDGPLWVQGEFGRVARRLVKNTPAGPERTVALRKLLEAQDQALRAAAT